VARRAYFFLFLFFSTTANAILSFYLWKFGFSSEPLVAMPALFAPALSCIKSQRESFIRQLVVQERWLLDDLVRNRVLSLGGRRDRQTRGRL